MRKLPSTAQTTLLQFFVFIWLFFGTGVSAFTQPLSGIWPKFNRYVESSQVELIWNSLPNATQYQVELAQNSSFSLNNITSGVLTQTYWNVTLPNTGTWFWRVTGTNPGGIQTSGINRFIYARPNDISGNTLWLKADSNVLISGGSVSSWSDVSNNGISFSQPTVLNQPLKTIAPEINNHPVLRFDGVNDFLDAGDVLDIGTNSLTTFIIVKGSGSYYAKFGSASAPQNIFGCYNIGAEQGHELAGASYQNFSSSNATGFHMLSFTADRQNNFARLRRNFNVIAQGNITGIPNSSYNFNTSNPILMGRYSYTFTPFYLNGEIGEVIFYDVALSDSLRNIVGNYLSDKYAPPINLGKDTTLTAGFCSITLTAPAGFTNLLWSTGATTSSINVSTDGTYWLRGTNLFGQVSYDTVQVSYPTIPSPTNTGICVGESNTWSAEMGPGFTYLWSTGATTPSIDISTPGTYSVTVTGAGGCSRSSGNYTFTIDNYETTAFLGNDTTLCSGNPIALQVGAAETVEYYWNGLSTGDQSSFWEVDTTGNYFLESVNVNGCVAQDTIFVSIIGVAPEANFSATNLCLGDLTLFTDQSVAAGSDPIVIWDWSFGDGNTSGTSDGENTYASAGTYTANLYVESAGGCGAQIALPITINTPPTANFMNYQNCSAETTLFVDMSTEGSTAINAWLWNFDNPTFGLDNVSSQQNPGRQFGTPGEYSVYLQVYDNNGCIDDTTINVTISQSPLASFSALDHCAGDNIQFTNISSIPAPDVITNYLWDFGDNTFSLLTTPNKTFFNAGFHTVTLIVTASNGCTSTTQDQIFTHANPVPAISVGPACAGNWTYLTDVSTVVTGTVAQSDWEIDLIDQLTGLNVAYMFQTTGSHNIELVSTSDFGCTGDTMIIINVQPGVTPNFSSFPEVLIAGEAVEFTNLSTGQTNILWDFGDGNNSTELNPSHVYNAIWTDSSLTVTLTASNALGCSGTSTQTFTINRPYFDLAINNIFLTENNGFYTVGVELKNVGTSFVEEADVILRMSNGTQLMDRYENLLQSGETTIMIFDAMPSAFLSDQNETEEFICAEAIPYSALNLQDEDLSNNTFCKNLEGSAPILIGPDPNPATQQFHFSVLISTESVVTVDLTDSRGRIVKRFYEETTLSKGLYPVNVPLHGLQSGVYTLRMISGDSAVTRRLLVTEE